VTRARLVLLALLLLTPLGCRQEMYDQPKYKDLRRSNFFDDRRQVRPLPDGTVAEPMPGLRVKGKEAVVDAFVLHSVA